MDATPSDSVHRDSDPMYLNGNGAADSTQSLSSTALSDYLVSLLPLLLSASDTEVRRSFLDASNAALIARFANEQQIQSVYVNKIRETRQQQLPVDQASPPADLESREDEDRATSTPTRFVYTVTTTLSWHPDNAASLALIKRAPTIDPTRSIAEQLHVLNLFGPALNVSMPSSSDRTAAIVDDDDGQASARAAAAISANPYESLHSIVHLAVQPYFEAYISRKSTIADLGSVAGNRESSITNSGNTLSAKSDPLVAVTASASSTANKKPKDSNDLSSNTGIPIAKKKFAELELSLLHLQQNVEIPETVLGVHPTVMRAVEQARQMGVRPTPELIEPASLLSDSSFLNKIQSEVNSWIKEVQNITKLSRDVSSGTASQEISFWLSMEKALEGIEEQLRSEPITLTLDILKHAKRFHATVSFIADTGLKESTDIVHKYNLLMKDFPLNELLAATDLDKIQDALISVLTHLNKKLKLSPYPIRRALPLVEAISKDFSEQLLRVLNAQKLMYASFPTFEASLSRVSSIFATWDDLIKEFTNVAREVTRKRSEKFLPIKINAYHVTSGLKARIEYVRNFRKHHQQLVGMVSPNKGVVPGSNVAEAREIPSDAVGLNLLGGLDMQEEVRLAWEEVKNVDVLDTSEEGTQIWVTAETAYNERVARVENQIIAKLRDRLGTARNASEMFRVFSRFNALFVRPKIRGAIQEYQNQLIESVKDDIQRLHKIFRVQYKHSEAYHMAQLRDLSPIAGAINWAKQIERQLNMYMKRVEDVLGKGWELYAEGAKLASESNSFRRKLDTRPIYEAWLHEINRRDLQISGRLFDVQKTRAPVSYTDKRLVNGHSDAKVDDGFVYSLAINFDPQIITLFKEVRNLLWLGFSVPHAISNIAKDAKRVYPHAVSLMETVRTYQQTIVKVQKNPGILPLVAEHRRDAQAMITRGMSLRWEFFVNAFESRQQVAALLPAAANDAATADLTMREGRHGTFVRELASAVSMFQDRTDSLVEVYAEVMKIIDGLSTCAYTRKAFESLLTRVQKAIDTLGLEGYANLDIWVKNLEVEIERTLLHRLEKVIDNWTNEFYKSSTDETGRTNRQFSQLSRTLGGASTVSASGLSIEPSIHEIRIKNQVIYLDPPVEAAKMSWYTQLQSWLGVICNLPRLKSSHQEIGLNSRKPILEEITYIGLLPKLSAATLQRPFKAIESRTSELAAYVNKWLEFQALWDVESEYVYNRLGDSLNEWQQLLLEIRRTRSTFDTSESHKDVGIAIINYEQVQSKVNAKYDAWQRDILSRFGAKLGLAMRDTHTEILKARHDLELHSIETSSTTQAVALITFVQELKRRVAKWTPAMETYAAGQKTLEKQRYQFPSDWLSIDQLELEWTAFNDILTRKNSAIQEQLAGLQIKILAEDKIVQNRVAEILNDWEQNKPISGDLKVDIAISSVNTFEVRVNQLKDQVDMVARAKEALNMETAKDGSLLPVIEEVRDLKAVWTALSGVWSQINEIRDVNWSMVQPRKLRQQLDSLLASTREMPSRMRQYAAFEFVQDLLRQLLKANAMVADLKSEALRERHWRQLFKALRISTPYTPSLMSLGTVWDLDLKKNESAIREIIIQAQGEVALEEFLKQVKDTWSSYSLDLVNYQNKTRLIRGWDDLFAKCSENINSLNAMKHSPYFRVFEEDASAWDDRLNRVHVLFDIWIDVQRQWVYLEGIFASSADIKHLLPIESARFSNINSEFLSVMKKVSKSPFVMDVLNIAGVQKSLERLLESLGKIQKALGEYLERERSSFPRFYFVGDEDLLEIIGNSKDIRRIMKHLKKMFAGISTLLLEEEEDGDTLVIVGMASKEGEEVLFSHPIHPASFTKINDWLAMLETEMKVTLSDMVVKAVPRLASLCPLGHEPVREDLLTWIGNLPAQLVILAAQINWTKQVEDALRSPERLQDCLALVMSLMDTLADAVLEDLSSLLRKKCESLITELVHQRDVLRLLIQKKASSHESFDWLYHMRFYLDNNASTPTSRVKVRMADVELPYGFEYLGTTDRLVQTPLTDKCYLTLTQALFKRLGGSPFGPAGTGKTESVKALGAQLGRFVVVFCCDESFDFQSMGRIFVGLCQVGAWGCFDEFNRLEERMLSAVSQQVQNIQLGLLAATHDPEHEIELVGRQLKINAETGIFITMNPGYAGRSNLPDNLKKLFRSIAMTKPDKELIAQVILLSQGYRTAERLATKVVHFFQMCNEKLSAQVHYDFGLRALKAVLTSAGHLKRLKLQKGGDLNAASAASENQEDGLVIQSIVETMVPKLIPDDIVQLKRLLGDTFPGVEYRPADVTELKKHIESICKEQNYLMDDQWLEKLIQIYQVQSISHGLMMVGPSPSGKTVAWKVLLAALERLEGMEGVSYVIDPKAISKDQLYGTLDRTTREWNDGLFTHILRKIIDNVRGESHKRHWIVFDGDIDPEWVENLNSLLDDNKILTLPNGERLNLPSNVRILFEVDSLQYATLATVSRCGMVWFSESTVSFKMLCHNYLNILRTRPLGIEDDDIRIVSDAPYLNGETSSVMSTQVELAAVFEKYFAQDAIVAQALAECRSNNHIMTFTEGRMVSAFFSLLNKTVKNILDYNQRHTDFPLAPEKVQMYISKRMLVTLIWAFAGDTPLAERATFGNFLIKHTDASLPSLAPGSSLIDFDVHVHNAEWYSWQAMVPTIDVETHAVLSSDVVIPTVDTARHEQVLYSWLSEHKPLLLCGPPGSGKTMTLFSALRKLPELEVVGLNFSSATTPELLLKTFDQHCEYRKTPNGVVLSPIQPSKWLVLFCDEINLPATDQYGTQRIISFLRQLVESGGFWRASDKSWVRLERIQFVGACNPPTDAGRVPLSTRFLRHTPLIMVDYPGELSLTQIYSTFNRAVLKVVPNLRAYAEPLTTAMIEVYLTSQQQFTAHAQAHYIYSPRELTRWVRGIYQALKPLESLAVEGLLRIWAHEALRLFQDRLVSEHERDWTDQMINQVARKHFPGVGVEEALERPILFSNWTSKDYVPIDREELREFVKARLHVFYEEELDVPLVLFNAVLDHVLRIDRVFRQIQGHMLLIGVSGSGKTTLSRFVAWMNGISVFQIKAHNRYTSEDFDDDLRTVLRRAGCKGEKICFIMDESNVLNSGFLERMNTLLANAEVPGLFEGDEYSALMTACTDGAQRDGLLLDTQDELYRWFTQQVARNLHVVFTMNPPDQGLASKAATSPALFNRCVLDWFGDWSDQAFYQVASEFTKTLDLEVVHYEVPANFPIAYRDLVMPPTHRDAVANAMVSVHQSVYTINKRISRKYGRVLHVTPRHYLDFIAHYVRLFNEKKDQLGDQQRHLNTGLHKLRDTVAQVEDLRRNLATKRNHLESKNMEANAKLQSMVADQREAEQQKAASLQIQKALDQQQAEIEERRAIVMEDLAAAEPAVLDAQAAVSNIKKQHLTEVRSMSNPPEAVKLAMESVCTLLGHQIDNWRTVQGIIRRDDFITNIVNFDTERQMTKRLRDKMNHEYISRPTYNYETVNRASKACGPLVKWVLAQVGFSEILDKVGPLRSEVQTLEDHAASTEAQASTIFTMIHELEDRISQLKDEYALLISETQAIKAEMERVQTKVERSLKLLASLESERDRWEIGSARFDEQMGTLAGNVLLSAATLTYAGCYDQQTREDLWQWWSDHLQAAGILYKPNLSFIEYLSAAEDRLQWQSEGLPTDQLCTENAIMLHRFNRYPLIVDPTGQAIKFLANHYQGRKIAVTSFLDEAFLKNLESALRFGTALLIQDVERLDPILNPVLNRELRRTGGRVLVRLGNQDIDFSPTFTLFLSTRDSSLDFAPDISSRVTFANFTMTPASLQSQSLTQVLRKERPDTEQKRSDLLKLQGEYQMRLQILEQALLQALNESSGNILDDEKVIDTLETLKREAEEVTAKAREADAVMCEVETVTAQYAPLASACSSIYFALERLSSVNRYYQFSLRFFQAIFTHVLLKDSGSVKIANPPERLKFLLDNLFVEAITRASRTLLHKDHAILYLVLARIKAKILGITIDDAEMDYLESTAPSSPVSENTAPQGFDLPFLSVEQAHALAQLLKLPAFTKVPQAMRENMESWTAATLSPTPEVHIPEMWTGTDETVCAFRTVLLMKALRPDRVIPAINNFANRIFKINVIEASEYNLANVVSKEMTATTPIVMASVPGYDASFRVDHTVVQQGGVLCTSVAMGSQEGYTLADQAISSSSRTGNWVLVKNVHLAPAWLMQLEKRLHSMQAHPNFRLFLTLETNDAVPTSILRNSIVLMNEPPPGIRASVLDSLTNIPVERLSANGPVERFRLYFHLAWLHALLVERLRYVPVGFAKSHEFNESDFDAALSTIDSWTFSAARGRSNIDPASIPFDAIRTLLKQAIYGGRVDNDYDQRILDGFVDQLFTPRIYEHDFVLVPSEFPTDQTIIAPEGVRVAEYISWSTSLPEREPPSWLALPRDANQVLAIAEGRALSGSLQTIRMVSEEEA